MGKFDKQIVCVNAKDLLGDDRFDGFSSDSKFLARIKRHKHTRRRGDVEEDTTVKQLIGYALIVHPETKTVFAFQRSSDASKYAEKRLHGNWSWGVGGHTEAVDGDDEPVTAALRRELSEEVGLDGGYELETLGFINDDTDAIGSVHFGVLYLVKVKDRGIKPADGELAHGEFLPIGKLRGIALSPDCTVENWSKIALEPLASFLGGRK
jgi:predicted NUDIX family phosphoesterase